MHYLAAMVLLILKTRFNPYRLFNPLLQQEHKVLKEHYFYLASKNRDKIPFMN
ncbi:hypothetical protein VCHA50P424_140032 [Vibrio chagasii]|nr:hypothetical protein VCHA50P424_140032 [Vibrio chagasii]